MQQQWIRHTCLLQREKLVCNATSTCVLYVQQKPYLESDVRGAQAGKLRHGVGQEGRDGLDLLRRQRLIALNLRSEKLQRFGFIQKYAQ